MNTKLTLRMDEALIASAKDYAAAHGSSVSQMEANYFAALGFKTADRLPQAATDSSPANDANWEQELGPLTCSVLGIASPPDGSPVPTDEDYYRYLEAKHAPK